jgi:hypothetical protein
MKLFKKLIAAPAIISMASGFAVNAAEINTPDLSDFARSSKLVSLDNFKSDSLFPGDWAYDSLKDLTNSPKFNGNSVSRLEAAAELNNLIAGGEGLMNGAAIDRLSNELGSELAIMKGRVDGLEARVNTIEAGSFSDTSTASFSVKMAIGAVDGFGEKTTGTTNAEIEGDQTVQFQYAFDTKIKTSFTGEDSLVVAIDSGSSTAGPVDEYGLNNTSDQLKVDGVAYKFPVGESITAMVADNQDGSSMFTTACAYGGPSDTLDDCGNVNAAFDNGGFMTGAEYDFGNGWTAAVGYAGPETDIMTKEGLDGYGANVAYTADNYGVSLTYGSVDSDNGATTPVPDGEKDVYTALNAYYSFDSGLSVSAGYEVGDIGGAVATADESINYFFGVSAPAGPGELGAAFGTSGGQIEGQDDELMYEAYYSYPVNDGMTITPLVFVKEKTAEGVPDQTGVMVMSTFKF